ncbi:hypothetical protein ACQKNX_07935 [Lysinibacillus sp. NPDC093712]|uniref:hypothetical protein n=1 Tax=Lysinibacillus sp. NPDC093712 TaxID=3390579 RepID=UPI003D007D7B
MNIKDNIDDKVLSHVANEMNITEDLLIKVVSTDLHNGAIMLFIIVLGSLFVGISLGILSYFRFKKYNNDFFAELFAFASGVIIFMSILIFALTGGYSDEREVLYNNDFAVVKEINRIYKESFKSEQN